MTKPKYSHDGGEKDSIVLYGINQLGMLIHAKYANAGEPYKCPICGIDMHVSHRLLTYFFACYEGKQHTNSACRNSIVIRDILLTNLEKFFRGLETPSTASAPPGGGLGPTRPAPDDVIILPCTKLEHLYDIGLFHYSLPDDMIGPFRVGDILVTKAMIPSVMRMRESLSHRVVYALPDWVDYSSHTICFVLLNRTRNRGHHAVEKLYFMMAFGHHYRDFQHFRNQLFDKHGAPISNPVLFEADWHYTPYVECFHHCRKGYCIGGNQICMGFQIGNYHSQNQIFIPPLDQFQKLVPPQSEAQS